MNRTNSEKSAALSDASAEERHVQLPVITVRHGAGHGAGDDGDAERTVVQSPTRNFSYPYSSPNQLNRRESAVSYHQGLMHWHRSPRCEYEPGRNQQRQDPGHSKETDSDGDDGDDNKGKKKLHRPPSPFPMLSGQSDQSQISPTEDPTTTDADSDADRRSSEQEQEEQQRQNKRLQISPNPSYVSVTSGGGKGHPCTPGGMAPELPPRFSTPRTTTPNTPSDDNLLLQPYTLSPGATPVGRRKLFSARRVLFAPPTPTDTRRSASSRDSPLDRGAERTAAMPSSSTPPAITISALGETSRVFDARSAEIWGRWRSWMSRHSNKEEDAARNLSLSEFYSQGKVGDVAEADASSAGTTAPGIAAARPRTPRKRRMSKIVFAAMLALLALVVIGSWCAIIFEWRKHSSVNSSRTTPAETSIDTIPLPTIDPMSTKLDPSDLASTQQVETANQPASPSSSIPQSLMNKIPLDGSGKTYSTVVYGKTIVTINSSALKDLTPTLSLLPTHTTPDTATIMPAETPFTEDTRPQDISNDRTGPEVFKDGDGGGHPMVTVIRRDPKPHDEPDTVTTFVSTTYVTPPSREQEPSRSTSHSSSHTTTAATVPPQESHPSTGTFTSTSTATETRTHPKVTTMPPGKTQAGNEAAQNSPTYCPFADRPDIWTICMPVETGHVPPSSASGPAARNPLAGLGGNLQEIRSGLERVGTYAAHYVHLVKAVIAARWSWGSDSALMLRPRGDGDEVKADDVDCGYTEQNRTLQLLSRGRRDERSTSPRLLYTSPPARHEHHKDPLQSSRGFNSVAEEKATAEARIADLRRRIETTAELVRAQLQILENQRAVLAQQRESIARAAQTLREHQRARGASDT